MTDNVEAEDTPEPQDASLATIMAEDLARYDLGEEDLELLKASEDGSEPMVEVVPRPVVAVIGRPNVGKSTLVNRILGKREAVVQDIPGVTRDRVMYEANWAGKDFVVVDTGGWEVNVKGLDRKVADQAELAAELADLVVFVVDANVGATSTDERVVEMLRASGKPVILVVNKADSVIQEAEVHGLWALGLGEPFPISALHGRGAGDLLDEIAKQLPKKSAHPVSTFGQAPARVALIGRPNVGKSSLLNALAGEDRAVVHSLAGTTRDPVDESIWMDGREWKFIDTAGVKRRMHRVSGADYYASLRTRTALERAEVALVLLDAAEPLSDQDLRVIQDVVDAGRALVIVNNKWDLVDEDRRWDMKREEDRDLSHFSWAPRINVSAKTKWHVNRIPRALDAALEGWETRIPTGKLNAFLGRLASAHPHPLRGGKQPRILFATQPGTAPPRFVLFTTGFLDPSYRRFIERRMREEFGFVGSPIKLSVRVREKRKK